MIPTRRLLLFIRLLLLFLFAQMTKGGFAQTCTSNLYGKYYDVNAPKVDFFFSLPGGGTMFGGRTYVGAYEYSIVKTKPDGNIAWHKMIKGNMDGYSVSKGRLTPNYNVLVGFGPEMLVLDTNGVVQKQVSASWTNGGYILQDMKVDANGDIVVLYFHDSNSITNGDSYYLVKYKSDLSAVLWTKCLGTSNGYFPGLSLDGDKIFVTGSYGLFSSDVSDGCLLCFDTRRGDLIKQFCLTLNGYPTKFTEIQRYNNGYLLKGFYYPSGGVSDAVWFQKHVFVRLDTTLQPIRAFRLTNIDYSDNLMVSVEPDGGFYGVHGDNFLQTYFYGNNRDSIAWTAYNNIVFWSGGKTVQFFKTTSNLWMITNFPIAAHKTDLNGAIGNCQTYPLPFGTLPVSLAIKNKSLNAVDTTPLVLSSINYALEDKTFNTMNQCNGTSSCSSVKLIGPTGICTSGTPVTFKGRRNPGCRLPVLWKVNGAPVNSSVGNDSTFSVQFLTSGHYQLVGSLPSECGVISDTLNVDVTLSSQPALNLGSDATLCPGNVLLLNAHKGYMSYVWQDGSTDSTYSVTQPGKYYVTVSDACGKSFSDTVNVLGQPPIPFAVSPDRAKCNNDTIQFSAPPGFMNYTWSPQYNISSTTSANVVVNPSVDTTYFVRAEKTPGCFAQDTIRVRVNHSPAIDLGSDMSFCSGDSITLDAGPGFSSYSWNGISGTQTNIVRSAGTYSVAGTTSAGCKAFDTLRVLNVWSLPIVTLDKNPGLCLGSTRNLNPGSYSSYSWQDGSVAPTYTINRVGTYWVRVTDNHNCVGSDTTNVTTVLALPSGFLPQDTAICSYGTLTLKPLQSFVSYAWSSGSAQSAITVDKPGDYWLRVTDQNGCLGRDTITVNPKQCMTGVYIPTAFTPNHDGKNDEFKAMIFGPVKKFELTVYNRWGQVIFYTTNPSKGWDGKIAGIEQRSDAFVWTCRYQLDGSPETFEKGTLTIIR